MKRARVALFLTLTAAGLTALPAQAQTTPPSAAPPPAAERLYLAFDLGAQVGTHQISAPGSASLYGETATFTSRLKINNAAMLNLEGGVRTYRSLYTSVAYTARLKTSSGADVNAEVPHPLFSNEPRAATASVSPIENSETALHISIGWDFAAAGSMRVRPFGGFSIYGVKQDTISGVTPEESGQPFSSVAITATKTKVSKFGAAGYNVGLDASYMFSRRVGARVLLRFSGATVDLTQADGTKLPIDAGGFDGGIGIRFRF